MPALIQIIVYPRKPTSVDQRMIFLYCSDRSDRRAAAAAVNTDGHMNLGGVVFRLKSINLQHSIYLAHVTVQDKL